MRMKMNKFNQVYNKIKNNISIIVEDFNNNSLLMSGSFDFKTDTYIEDNKKYLKGGFAPRVDDNSFKYEI